MNETTDTDDIEEQLRTQHRNTFVPKHDRDDDTPTFSWSRAEALARWKREQGLPVVDYDGSVITEAEVEHRHHGWAITHCVSITDGECDRCGETTTEYTFNRMGPERAHREVCCTCGDIVDEGSTL